MAMIVEVLHPRSGAVVHRARIAALPFTIGRALDNALIVDDPHVDARHAQVSASDDALLIEDLGSLNGLVFEAGTAARAPLVDGTRVRIGRTVLRFRDETAPIAAAIPLAPSAPTPSDRWYASIPVRVAFSVFVLCVLGLEAWLETAGRSGANDALGTGLGLGALMAAWAGIWSAVARIAIHRSRFITHLSIAALTTLAFTLLTWFAEWMQFMVPDAPIWPASWMTLGLAILATSVALHLANATTLPTRLRWTAGVVTSAVLLAFTGIFALAKDDSFSDVPVYEATIKPLDASLVPAMTVDGLPPVYGDLRATVDSLAAEPRS